MTRRVWYAAFGSNLSYDRFLIYLTGGQAEGSSGHSPGARDQTEPARSRTMHTPRRLGFAGKSARWSGGGVAFLDSDPAQHWAALRTYDITVEQFEDVFQQENGLESPIVVDVDRVVADRRVDLTNRWYGRILYLGDHDGLPILTFTSASPPAAQPPHPTYLHTIVRGLESSVGGQSFDFPDRPAIRSYLETARGMDAFPSDGWENAT